VEKVSFEPGTNSECVMEGKNHKQILSRTKTRNGQPFWLSFAPVLRNESSKERKFHTWNFRSRERMLLGAKSPVTIVLIIFFQNCIKDGFSNVHWRRAPRDAVRRCTILGPLPPLWPMHC